MDFFNNEQDNSKRNEQLLDIIMEEHKRREKKHNINKGYLLNKRTGKVSNPFERNAELEKENVNSDDRDFKHAPVDGNTSKEPLFVVKGGTYHNNKKRLSKKSSNNNCCFGCCTFNCCNCCFLWCLFFIRTQN